jgi:hypothetical protein
MGCELPSPGQPVIVPADSHDWEDDEWKSQAGIHQGCTQV